MKKYKCMLVFFALLLMFFFMYVGFIFVKYRQTCQYFSSRQNISLECYENGLPMAIYVTGGEITRQDVERISSLPSFPGYPLFMLWIDSATESSDIPFPAGKSWETIVIIQEKESAPGNLSEKSWMNLLKSPRLENLIIKNMQVPAECWHSLPSSLTNLCIEDVALTEEALEKAPLASLQFLKIVNAPLGNVFFRKIARECVALESLELNHTQVVDTAVEEFRSREKLKFLSFRNTPVSDAGLRYFPASVNHLDLSGTRISDEGIKLLMMPAPLMELKLSGTNISDKGVEHLPMTTDLDLSGTKVTNACTKFLPNLLLRINISGTEITSLENFQRFEYLKELTANDLSLTSESLEFLPKSLQKLKLKNTVIPDSSWELLSQKPRFSKTLFVYGVDSISPQTIEKLATKNIVIQKNE